VYANLGFVQDAEGDMGIEPDYSLSVSDVNIQLVLALLEHHKRLDILRCCELSIDREDMPSWTPNWSIRSPVFENTESDAYAPAEACYVGNGILKVRGILGAILATTEIYKKNSLLRGYMLRDLQNYSPNRASYSFPG